MRISDLSRKSGVPVATIKFYLREHLLPQGVPTGRNQAVYDERHLRRLWLIRALSTIGQLDLSSIRELVQTIENDQIPLRTLYETVDRARFPADPVLTETDAAVDRAHADVDEVLDRIGWRIDANTRGRLLFAQVLAGLQRLGCECGAEFFVPYAQAAERLAVAELDLLPSGALPDQARPADRAAAAVRSILLEVALAALCRMAQEYHLTLRSEAAAARSR